MIIHIPTVDAAKKEFQTAWLTFLRAWHTLWSAIEF